MSWDGYIDTLIAQSVDGNGSAHCDSACIIGLDGGARWTSDAHAKGMKLSPQEGAAIAACFKSRDFSAFMSNGIRAEGNKYQFLREEDSKVVMAKKKDLGALTLQSTKTAIIIGHTAEGSQQGNVNKAVAYIADYLEGSGM
jgi:profilin